uniref:C2 domain-containing protein n=1 Tax=Bombyx mori TaxID=7091 RepID=A0A8R2LXG4_BOMMO|nr:uncharacterized protein LOC101746698 isoform X2 [Bombyx mori]
MANKSVSVSESKHNGLKTKTHSEVSCWNCLKIDDPDWDPEPLTLRGIRKHNRHKFRLYPFFASEISKPKALPLSQKVSEHYSIGKKVEEKIVKYAEKKEKNIAKEVTPQVTEKTDSSIDQALPSNVVKGTTSQTENASNKLRPPFIENSTIVKITENKLGAVEVFETQNATENISKRSVNDSSNDIDEIQATSGQKKSDNSDELRAINKNVTEEIVNSVKSNQTLQELNFDDIKNAKNIKFISQNKDLQAIGQIKQTSLDSLTTQLDPVKDVASCENIKEVQRNTSNISENIRSTEIKKIQLQDSVTNNIDHIEPAHIISAIQYHDQSKITVPIEKITQTDYAETDQKFLKKDSTHTREPKSKITTTSYENPVKERVSPDSEKSQNNEDQQKNDLKESALIEKKIQSSPVIDLSPRKLDVKEHQEELKKHGRMDKIDNVEPIFSTSVVPKDKNQDEERCHTNILIRESEKSPEEFVDANTLMTDSVTNIKAAGLDIKEQFKSTSISSMLSLKEHIPIITKNQENKSDFETLNIVKDKEFPMNTSHMDDNSDASENIEIIPFPAIVTSLAPEINPLKDKLVSENITSSINEKLHVGNSKIEQYTNNLPNSSIRKGPETTISSSCFGIVGSQSKPISLKNTLKGKDILCGIESDQVKETEDSSISNKINEDLGENLTNDKTSLIKDTSTQNIPELSIKPKALTKETVTLPSEVKEQHLVKNDQIKGTVSDNIMNDLPLNINKDSLSLNKEIDPTKNIDISEKETEISRENYQINDSPKKGEPESEFTDLTVPPSSVIPEPVSDKPITSTETLKLSTPKPSRLPIKISQASPKLRLEETQDSMENALNNIVSNSLTLATLPKSPRTLIRSDSRDSTKMVNKPEVDTLTPKLLRNESTSAKVIKSPILATLPKSSRTLIRSNSRDSTKMVNKPEVDTLTSEPLKTESTSAKVIKSPTLATLPKSPQTLIRSDSRDSTKMVNKPEVDTLTQKLLRNESTSAKVIESSILGTLPKSPRTLIRSDSRDSTKIVNKPEVDTLTPKLLRKESTSAKVIKSSILATLPKSPRTLIRSDSRDSTKMVNTPEVDTSTPKPLKTESTSAKVIKSPTLATLPKSPKTLIRSDSRDSTKMLNKPEVDTLTPKLLKTESTSAKVIESPILGTLPKSPRTLIRSDSRDSTKMVNKPEVDTLTPKLLRKESTSAKVIKSSILATLPKSPRTLIRSDSRDSTKMVNTPEVDTSTPKPLKTESTSAKVIKSPTLATLPKSPKTLIRSDSRDSTKMLNKPEVDTLTPKLLKTESTSAKVIESPILGTLPKSPRTLIRSDSRDSTKMVNKPEVDTLTPKLLRKESTSAKVIKSSILATLPKSPKTLIRSDSRDSTKIVNLPKVETSTPKPLKTEPTSAKEIKSPTLATLPKSPKTLIRSDSRDSTKIVNTPEVDTSTPKPLKTESTSAKGIKSSTLATLPKSPRTLIRSDSRDSTKMSNKPEVDTLTPKLLKTESTSAKVMKSSTLATLPKSLKTLIRSDSRDSTKIVNLPKVETSTPKLRRLSDIIKKPDKRTTIDSVLQDLTKGIENISLESREETLSPIEKIDITDPNDFESGYAGSSGTMREHEDDFAKNTNKAKSESVEININVRTATHTPVLNKGIQFKTSLPVFQTPKKFNILKTAKSLCSISDSSEKKTTTKSSRWNTLEHIKKAQTLKDEVYTTETLLPGHATLPRRSNSPLPNERDTLERDRFPVNRSGLQARSESMASVYSGAGEGTRCNVTVRGEVQFSLLYNYRLGALEVGVKRCRDLAPIDAKRNRSDPYVKVYLLPDKSKAGKRKTKVKKNTLNPVFEETLSFAQTLASLSSRTLWLSVWHADMFGRNDFLGEVSLPLADVVFDDPAPTWYKLHERTEHFDEQQGTRGDLIVGLKFELHETGAMRGKGTLHVLVKEAKNLVATKPNGLADVFCKSYLLPERGRLAKQKTSVARRTLSPRWEHTFTYRGLKPQDLAARALELSLWDRDRLASNDFMGAVRLSLGTGTYMGANVNWMDSAGKEVSLWQTMMERPNFWVEGSLPLRPQLIN